MKFARRIYQNVSEIDRLQYNANKTIIMAISA